MELRDVMLKRRSIRRYTDEPIPEEKLERILEAGLLAPTSMNKRPWEFFVVRDRETLARLSKAKAHGAGLLAGAAAAIAVFADGDLSDVWVEDCSIALSYMDLAAADQGIGSCWVQMRLRRDEAGNDAEQNVKDILGAASPYRLVGLMSLGIPAEEKPPYDPAGIKWEKVHR